MYTSKGVIGKINPHKKISIVGGGISGLFIAYYLKKAGLNFELFEKESKLGGKIGTTKGQYGLRESAANAIFSNDEVHELLNELNLKPIAAPKTLKKMIWRNSKITSPPISFFEIISILPSFFKRPVVTERTTVQDFLIPLLGTQITDQVASSVFAGIYAEHIEHLHFTSIFKSWNNQKTYFKFFFDIMREKKKQKYRPESLSFPNGMQDLITALHNYLKDNIHVNSDVETLSLDNIILCTPAREAAKIIRPLLPAVANELEKIKYNKLSTATLITPKQIPFLKKAFGILFTPKQKGFKTLGVLANSEVFPNRIYSSNLHSYTFILKTSEANEEDILKDLSALNCSSHYEQKLELAITHWPSALPIYNFNRYQSILKLRSQFLKINPGLCLFGNYVDGISLREILLHAKNFVDDLKSN